MSLTRYASMQILAAKIAPAGGGPLMRTAHRHEFEYEPRPGYLYVRSRMISSRTNDNFDHFPAEEIKKAYATFIGKPVFVNHHNDNHRRARGVIKDAVLHEDVNPDGSPDVWVEGLMEVDAVRFPKLAQAILAGHIDRTSMGTDVAFSVCSVCNNKASSPVEYCQHIPKLKGQKVWRRSAATGQQEGILVYEKCYGLGFFENSLLVEEPADPTAYFLGVDARGLGKAASKIAREWGTDEDEISDGVDLLDPDNFGTVFDYDYSHHEACDGSNRVNSSNPGTCPHCGQRYSATSLVVPYHADLSHTVARKTAGVYDYKIDLACGDTVNYVGSTHGQVKQDQSWNCSTHGEVKVSDVSGSGTTNGLGMDKSSSLRVVAEDKVLAPADVDTLRDEQCPVCSEESAYDGEKCQVCGFIAPPGEFGDPDTEKAKATDLRQQADDAQDKGGDLACDSCGATFSSAAPAAPAPKVSVVLDPEKGTEDSDDAASVESKAGDPCPTCGEGTLQPSAAAPGEDAAAADADGFAPAGSGAEEAAPDASDGDEEDDADDADGADGSDGEDRPDGKKPSGLSDDKDSEDGNPFSKKKDKKKPTAARRGSTDGEGADVAMRPALAALAAQQKQIDTLKETLAFVVKVAGLENHPRTASLLKSAADDNPAFGGGWDNGAPVEGAPEAPSETTQEAATPTAKDDVESVGSTPLTDVTPQATTSLEDSGVTLDVTEPETVDVTAPIAGTDDLGKGGRGQAGTNHVETDVRSGTPSDNSAAFRDGGFLGSKDEGRTIASLRLARLQIQAGIAGGDDLDLGGVIASSDRSDESIQSEIETLAKVVTAAKQPQRVARNLVPQGANAAQRMVPSMTADAGIQAEASIGSVSDEEMAFE